MVLWFKQSVKKRNEQKSNEQNLKDQLAAVQDALCEMDEQNAERLAAIEDALCDIDAGA